MTSLASKADISVLLRTITESRVQARNINKSLQNDLNTTPAMLIDPVLKSMTEAEETLTAMIKDIESGQVKSETANNVEREAPRCCHGHQMVQDQSGADFCDKCNSGKLCVYRCQQGCDDSICINCCSKTENDTMGIWAKAELINQMMNDCADKVKQCPWTNPPMMRDVKATSKKIQSSVSELQKRQFKALPGKHGPPKVKKPLAAAAMGGDMPPLGWPSVGDAEGETPATKPQVAGVDKIVLAETSETNNIRFNSIYGPKSHQAMGIHRLMWGWS
mmetsp:Transcript_17327/g.38144  ORF Transcript_17327/g.38144 Transcript_17327/m.38144 type:complete len:276 (+) Transcript_17327:57-884(+)